MYVELKCKTNFSFLRGASDSRDYVLRAKELGMSGIGIADINGVYSLPRAYEIEHSADFKLIHGAEVTFLDHSPLTLIATNRDSYAMLCRIITCAHKGKEKGNANLTTAELIQHLEDKRSNGLIALMNVDRRSNYGLMKELFRERLYITSCKYLDGLDDERSKLAYEITKTFEIQVVATNDVHYHIPSRRRLQDTFTCIRESKKYREAGFNLFGNDERYLKSYLQMASLFRGERESLKNTLVIAEQCSFKLTELTYKYPKEIVPPGYTPQSYFEELVLQGAQKIYRGQIPFNVDQQIRHEFGLIKKMDYASYFLTIYDIVRFANNRGIICQGRGSAANSISCYCLGITAIDPVQLNLLFERFISEERAEPPDIDVDFEHERREEVLQYVYSRYGRDHAAMISAIRTYQDDSSFLEVSKAMGVNVGTISSSELDKNFDQLAGADSDKRPLIETIAKEALDFPRHLSIHSGGFTLSEDPLIEIVPVEPARMEGRDIIQWDKNDIDTLKLLKVDLLALGFLTALHKICDYIEIDWRDIPSDDNATYDMICKGDTEGTFQIESRAQKAVLPRIRPRNLYDLTVNVGSVRPGPIEGGMLSRYIERREKALRGIKYILPDPALEDVLGRTYGIPIFQEQVMKLAIVKAGFTAGEADQLRRSIASWRSSEAIGTMAQRLYDGLIKNGISKEWADELFKYMEGFAHYGFPESHAASFALIAYKSAYLKCHHPAAMLCGLINSQPMGFYPISVLISVYQRAGVLVLPIDINLSNWDAVLVDKKTVRMGFREIKGIRKEDVEKLILERNVKPYADLLNFVQRTQLHRDVIERMALADCFKSFAYDQRHSFWKSIEFKALFESSATAQLSLFSTATETDVNEHRNIFKDMTMIESVSEENKVLSYSLKGHMMAAIRMESQIQLPKITSAVVKQLLNGRLVHTAGFLIVMQKPPTAKGVCFITLEDEFGTIDLILKKEIYERFREQIAMSRFLEIKGVVQLISGSRSVLVKWLQPLFVEGVTENQKAHSAGMHPRSL